jgi:hypothetical protein
MPEQPKSATDFLLNGNTPIAKEPSNNSTDFLLNTFKNKQEFNAEFDKNPIPLKSDERYTLDPNKYETKYQSDFKSAVNNFWQGIDETQKSANEYHINAAELKISNNNKILGSLTDPNDPKIKELLKDNEEQSRFMQSATEDKIANQKEIDNEYVSKKYKLNQALVQGQGSEAGFFDKMVYTMPNMLGSSMSLVVPNLLATFGTKAGASIATAALTKAGLSGGRAGWVGSAFALVGALGGIAFGRKLETESEVGGQVTAVKDKLTQDYIDNAYYQTGEQITKDQIPQDAMDDIVIQANKGTEEMYWKNMALAIPDMAEALLFSPKLNLPGIKNISKAVNKAVDYNKATRFGTKAAKLGLVYESEKFEEGAQYAFGKRQEDFALNSGEYENKGFIKNLLTDSEDVLSSMNFSPIGEVRGSGRYAEDKEFQTAEESGGMLAAIMGGVQTVGSVAKDLNTYRKVNKELQADGIFNVDDKYFRLKDQILQKHFENETTHHLLEGVKNLIGKKNEDGTEILSQEDAKQEIDKVQKAFDTYQAVNSQVNEIEKKGAFLMFDSAQQKVAKKAVKDNLFHVSLQLNREQKELGELSMKREGILNTINDPKLKEYNNISDLIEKQTTLLDGLKNFNPIGIKESYNIPFRIKANEAKLKNLEALKKAEETRLTEAGIDFKVEPLTLAEQELNKQITAKSSLLDEQTNKYKELLAIKDDKTLQDWYSKHTKAKTENTEAVETKVPTLKHEEWYNKDTTPEDLDSRLKLAEQNKQITPEQAIELSEGYVKLKEENNNKSYFDTVKESLGQNNNSKEDLEGLKEILKNINLDENFNLEQQKELLDLVEEKLINLKDQAIDTSVPSPFEAQNVLITKADESNEKITSPVDGKTAGEFRAENNLLDFEELYNLLSDIFNNKKQIAYEFITENSFVYLTIDGKKVSAIQKKAPIFKTAEGKLDTESIDRFKAIQALFYAPSGAAKSKAEIEQLNKDLKSGRVKVNVYRNANINHEGNTNRENRKNLEELIYDLEAEGYDYVVYDDVSFKSKSKNVTTEDEKEIEADYKLRAVEEKDNGFTIGGYRLYIIGAKDSTGRIQSYKLNMAQNHNIEQELQDFKAELFEKINEKTPEGKNRWSDKEIIGFVVKFNKQFNLALKPKNDSSGNKKTKVLRFVWTPRTSEHPNGLLSLKYSEANAGQKARFYSFLPTKVDQEEYQKRLDNIFAINKEYKQAKNKTAEEKQEKLKLKAKLDKANQENKAWLKKNHINLEDLQPNDSILTIDYILEQLNNLSVNGPQGTVMIEDFKVGTVNMDVEKVDTNGDITIEGVFDSSALDTNFKREEQQNDGSIIPGTNAKVFRYSIQVSSTIKTTPITNPILAPKNPVAPVTKTKLEQVAEIEAKYNVTIDLNVDGTWERITHLKATGTRQDAINYTNVVRQLQTIGYKAKFLKKSGTTTTTTSTTNNSQSLNIKDIESGKFTQEELEARREYISKLPVSEMKKLDIELSVIDREIEKILGNGGVFSIGLEESTGIPTEEIENMKSMLPSFISTEDLKTIAHKLRINGIPYGVFKNKIIYLNTLKGKPGTAYHEAFHAVFRTMLTDTQIEKYLTAAEIDFRAAGKNMIAEMKELVKRVPAYARLSKIELKELVLEEHLADKFADVASKNLNESKETNNIIKQLFFKIKEFFKAIKDTILGNELDVLFDKIIKGSYKNSKEITNKFTDANYDVYSLLPGIKNTFLTLNQSNEIINTFASEVHTLKLGSESKSDEDYNIEDSVDEVGNITRIGKIKSDDELIDDVLERRLLDIESYADAHLQSLEGTSSYKSVQSLQESEKLLLISADRRKLLINEIKKRLSLFHYSNEAFEDTPDSDEVTEENGLKQSFGSKDAWLTGGTESISKILKTYIGFKTFEKMDPVTGYMRSKSINELAVYNSLMKILADKESSQMFTIMHRFAQSEQNPNLSAFYNELVKDLGLIWNEEEGVHSLPKEIGNLNIYYAIINNFNKSNVKHESIYTRATGNNKDGYTASELYFADTNKNSPGKITLDNWNNNLLQIEKNNPISKKAVEDILQIITNNYKTTLKSKKLNDPQLNKIVKNIKSELNKLGINLTAEYLKYSLLSHRSNDVALTTEFFTKEHINLLNDHSGSIVPMPFEMFNSDNDKGNLNNFVSNKSITSLYKKESSDEKLIYLITDLTTMAENNSIFDESVGSFSFKNNEGENVNEIINKSDTIEKVIIINSANFLNKLINGDLTSTNKIETKNFEFLKNSWIVKKLNDSGQKIKLTLISGFTDTTIRDGQFTKGITFGKFDQRAFILSAITLFHNKDSKTQGKYIFRQNEASSTSFVATLPKINTEKNFNEVGQFFENQFRNEYNRIAREQALFNEGKDIIIENYNTKQSDKAFNFTEFLYLENLLDSNNQANSKALYNELVNSAREGKDLTEDQLKTVLSAIGINKFDEQYYKTGSGFIGLGFDQFMETVRKEQIYQFIPDGFVKEHGDNFDQMMYEFYVNDYIMSNSINELLDGDYAISRKDKVDIVKRNRGSISSGGNFGRGEHTCVVIKDDVRQLTVKPINGKLKDTRTISTDERIETVYYNKKGDVVTEKDPNGSTKFFLKTKEGDFEVVNYKPDDAMTYSSPYHMFMGILRQGKLDPGAKNSWKKLLQPFTKDKNGKIVAQNLSNAELSHLFDVLASPNSKKTTVYDGHRGLFLKMSELALIRSATSFIESKHYDYYKKLTDELWDLAINDDFESTRFRQLTKELTHLYKPLPGMGGFHRKAQIMDFNGIDHMATASASKGATRPPIDISKDGYDLTDKIYTISNSSKRDQVATPTGKKEVTVGSQALTIVTSELVDTDDVLFEGKLVKVGNLKKIYQDTISDTRDESLKQALTIVRTLRDEIVKVDYNAELGETQELKLEKLNKYLAKAVSESGAGPQTVELFEGDYNNNLVQKLVKAEQVVLAHFSKGVLGQKTNGDKVSLVAGVDFRLIEDIKSGEIISHHRVLKDPTKYGDTTKYKERRLEYNKVDPITKEVYSECALSIHILERHGLKVGDIIPDDVLIMLGYRIPTGDKQSIVKLKVVSLLPNYYNGIGIFPDELVYLSGADFDIDSEFIQMPYFWFKSSDPSKPIKYDTRKLSDDDAWESYVFYNKNYNKIFKKEYKETERSNDELIELRNQLKSLLSERVKDVKDASLEEMINNKRMLIDILKDQIFAKVASDLNQIGTKEDYIKAGKPITNAHRNNKALEAMTQMLTSKGVEYIVHNSTGVDKIENIANELIDEGFIKENNTPGSYSDLIPSKHRSVSSINGKLEAREKLSQGSNGVGIVANKLQQLMFIFSNAPGLELTFNKDAFKFEIAEHTGGKYKPLDQNKQRIVDMMNALLNAYLDNGKNPIIGTLGIKQNLLNGVIELMSQGLDLKAAVKLIRIPMLQKYADNLAVMNNAQKTEIEFSFTKGSSIAQAYKNVTGSEESIENIQKIINVAKKGLNKAVITTKDIENILKDPTNPDYYTTQLDILLIFDKINTQGDTMGLINNFLRYNQGLDISFSEVFQKLHKSIDSFELNTLVGAKDEGLGTTKSHIDIKPLLKNDKNTLENIKRVLFIENRIGAKIFIEQTKPFKRILKSIVENLNPSFTANSENMEKVSRQLLGHISTQAYMTMLKETLSNTKNSDAIRSYVQGLINNFNYGLLFSNVNEGDKITTAAKLNLLKSDDQTKNNLFIKYITSKIYDNEVAGQYDNPFDFIETKSFTKLSPEIQKDLIDSVNELFSNNSKIDAGEGVQPFTTKDFVYEMIGYLMIKDNMQFKNNSLSTFLPPSLFKTYSKVLDNLLSNLVKDIKHPNFDLTELGYNFKKILITDKNTNYKASYYREIQTDLISTFDNLKIQNDTGIIVEEVTDSEENTTIAGITFRKPVEDGAATTFNKVLKGDDMFTEVPVGEDSESVLKQRTLFKKGTEVMVKTKKGDVSAAPIRFPQFIKFKIDGEVKFFELDSSRHPEVKEQGYVDSFATKDNSNDSLYRSVKYKVYAEETIGIRGISPFFAETFENAQEIFDKVVLPEREIKEGEEEDGEPTAEELLKEESKSVPQKKGPKKVEKSEVIEENILPIQEKTVSLEELSAKVGYYIKNNPDLMQQLLKENPNFQVLFIEAKKNKTEENLKGIIDFIEQELDKKIEDEEDPCNGGPKA